MVMGIKSDTIADHANVNFKFTQAKKFDFITKSIFPENLHEISGVAWA